MFLINNNLAVSHTTPMVIIRREKIITNFDNVYDIGYYSVRNSAWDFLIKNNITSYPLDIHKIVEHNEWKVISYPEYAKLRGISLEEVLQISSDGFTDIEHPGRYVIAINNKNTMQRNRFTICHEIGHILLHKVFKDEKRLEKEANMFAARILMPMLLIKELNITDPTKLATLCNVSVESASLRLKRFKEIKAREKFYTNPLEKQLYEQLKTFIQRCTDL